MRKLAPQPISKQRWFFWGWAISQKGEVVLDWRVPAAQSRKMGIASTSEGRSKGSPPYCRLKRDATCATVDCQPSWVPAPKRLPKGEGGFLDIKPLTPLESFGKVLAIALVGHPQHRPQHRQPQPVGQTALEVRPLKPLPELPDSDSITDQQRQEDEIH